MKAFFAVALLVAAPAAFAQNFAIAPPLAPAQTSVFDWRETPRNQQIAIVRAAFDSNGYLLTDENGQLISVPFSGNLYAMQFGKTSGAMYFVNDGNTPVLYLPDNGFLENAAVSGGRWFPFPQRYFYTRPVFLGVAPSWDAYCGMGWYPGMVVYGGYWGTQPWRTGIVYSPMSCLTISVGNRLWNTWDDYCGFLPGAGIRPIIIRDTRPIYIDQRDRFDRSRGNNNGNNGKNWDRDRTPYRESSRSGNQAPARNSEERAQGQGQGGSDRFNYGTAPTGNQRPLPGGNGRMESSSREREQRSYSPSPSYSIPSMTPVRPGGVSGGGGFSGGTVPGSGAREREQSRPGMTPGYSVPSMTPVRPGAGGSNYSGSSPAFPSRENRSSSSPSLGRPTESRPTGRTYDAPRESRGSSSSPSRESSSRERERSKK